MVLRSPSFNPPLKPLANFDQTWQRWSPFRIISNDHTQPSKMAAMTKNRKYWQNISSETTGPIGSKLWGSSPWMVPFQNFYPTILQTNQDGCHDEVQEIQQKINLKTISETTGPIVTKIWEIGSWMVPFRSVSDVPACQPRRLSFLRVENSAKNQKSPLTLLGPYLGGMGGSPTYQNFIRTIPTAHRDGHHH